MPYAWVQLPPGPSFPVVQLRYYFELIFDECRTNVTAMPMPYPTVCPLNFSHYDNN
jgi:hypothetical protein